MVVIESKTFPIAVLLLLNWHIGQYSENYTPKWITSLPLEVVFALYAAKEKDSVKLCLQNMYNFALCFLYRQNTIYTILHVYGCYFALVSVLRDTTTSLDKIFPGYTLIFSP